LFAGLPLLRRTRRRAAEAWARRRRDWRDWKSDPNRGGLPQAGKTSKVAHLDVVNPQTNALVGVSDDASAAAAALGYTIIGSAINLMGIREGPRRRLRRGPAPWSAGLRRNPFARPRYQPAELARCRGQQVRHAGSGALSRTRSARRAPMLISSFFCRISVRAASSTSSANPAKSALTEQIVVLLRVATRVWGNTGGDTGRGGYPHGDPQGDTGCRLAWSWITLPRSAKRVFPPPNYDKSSSFGAQRVSLDRCNHQYHHNLA